MKNEDGHLRRPGSFGDGGVPFFALVWKDLERHLGCGGLFAVRVALGVMTKRGLSRQIF